MLNGDGYFSLEDEDSIKEIRPFYKDAGNLILSTWQLVKDKGFQSFFSQNYDEHSLIGDLVTTLESYYYLIDDSENLFKILSNEVPAVDRITSFIFFDTHINIYRSEITRYAKEKNEIRSWALYKALIDLRNNSSIIIQNDLSTLEQLSELWEI
jgi:hypothetical protein